VLVDSAESVGRLDSGEVSFASVIVEEINGNEVDSPSSASV
jgi:hypothetical protein